MNTILVVEDEPLTLDVVAEHLELENYKVIKAFNVPHAMALLELNWIDLIVLDLNMPGKDGTYLFKYVDLNFTGLKIIAFSGLDLEDHPNKDLIIEKCSAFVSKKSGITDLLRVIKRVLE